MEDHAHHPEIGKQLIEKIPFLHGAVPIVYSHHEKWDGTGYPRGLRGEEIPLGARIFSVVDAFDAITFDRPYSKAIPSTWPRPSSSAAPGRTSTRRWWKPSCACRSSCSRTFAAAARSLRPRDDSRVKITAVRAAWLRAPIPPRGSTAATSA